MFKWWDARPYFLDCHKTLGTESHGRWCCSELNHDLRASGVWANPNRLSIRKISMCWKIHDQPSKNWWFNPYFFRFPLLDLPESTRGPCIPSRRLLAWLTRAAKMNAWRDAFSATKGVCSCDQRFKTQLFRHFDIPWCIAWIIIICIYWYHRHTFTILYIYIYIYIVLLLSCWYYPVVCQWIRLKFVGKSQGSLCGFQGFTSLWLIGWRILQPAMETCM